MSENTRKKIIRRKKKEQPRQNWKPHWVPNTLYHIWCALFSVFKVAAVAAITVALVVVVCAFVLVGLMGNYLQEDILTDSEMASLEYESSDLSAPAALASRDTRSRSKSCK